MSINHGLILLTLIFSFSNCIDLSEEEEYKDIEFMKPTKFVINYENKAYFQYKLDGGKEYIGLKFLKANSYTVNVTTFSSLENKEKNKTQYPLADNQFKEIDVFGFDQDIVYIVIEITKENYTYDDYLTIYESGRPIYLEHNKVITITNFLSDQKYEFLYEPAKNIAIDFFYNTKNYDDNYRMMTIDYNREEKETTELDSFYKYYVFNEKSTLTVCVENKYTKNGKNEKQSQEFTLMIREVEGEKHFNKIEINKIETINYIYSQNPQTFYFYANVTNMKELNTLNFKFDYRYYKAEKIKIKAKYQPLTEDIKQEDLIKYIPDTNDLISSYDIYSDEYYRIYLNNNKQESKYLYIFASIEINDDSYYYGSKSIEYSMGEQEELIDFTTMEYNVAKKIGKQTLYYIPHYWKLKLDKNSVYLLGIYNEHMFVTEFIRGDLISSDNTINMNVLESNNEIIVLSDIEEFTIKLFGIQKNVEVYIERVRKDEIEFVQEYREKNKIFKLDMKKDQTKYILGTYSYVDYAFGKLTEKYYPTKDSGEFEVLFSGKVGEEENHLFPSNTEKYIRNFDQIIDLKTHLDLFTIKCKSDGVMYIRPQYKQFDYTVRSVQDNKQNDITMSELLEVAQLSAPLGKQEGTLYFTINLINSQNSLLKAVNDNEITLIISPDTNGTFESGTIKGNQIFTGSIDLAKYRLDELGILLNTTYFGTQLKIVEKIRDKYSSYRKLNEEYSEDINSYNCYFIIPKNNEKFNISIENLNGKDISYGIIKTAVNDANYVLLPDTYEKEKTTIKISENNARYQIKNKYYNNTDESNPYIMFLFSVDTKENLNYKLNISLSETPSEPNNNTTKIIIIVVIIIVVVLIVVGIILFNVISKRRKNRSSSEIEKLESIDSAENQLT